MDIAPSLIALVSLAVVLVVWGLYFADIAKNSVSEMPFVSIAFQILALGATAVAIVQSQTLLVVAPGGLTLVLGGLFLFLLTQRKTPVGSLRVKVGDSLPPFSALGAEGRRFDSSSFDGRRILLKFFRGSW